LVLSSTIFSDRLFVTWGRWLRGTGAGACFYSVG
jgi:hypothetical protein